LARSPLTVPRNWDGVSWELSVYGLQRERLALTSSRRREESVLLSMVDGIVSVVRGKRACCQQLQNVNGTSIKVEDSAEYGSVTSKDKI
jgi:hypothetical protein